MYRWASVFISANVYQRRKTDLYLFTWNRIFRYWRIINDEKSKDKIISTLISCSFEATFDYAGVVDMEELAKGKHIIISTPVEWYMDSKNSHL